VPARRVWRVKRAARGAQRVSAARGPCWRVTALRFAARRAFAPCAAESRNVSSDETGALPQRAPRGSAPAQLM